MTMHAIYTFPEANASQVCRCMMKNSSFFVQDTISHPTYGYHLPI